MKKLFALLLLIFSIVLSGCALQSTKPGLTPVDPFGKPINAAPVDPTAAEAAASVKEKFRSICSNPEFVSYYAMTPCNSPDIEFRHLANETKITAEQKPIFSKVRSSLDSAWITDRAMMRKYGGENGKITADRIETTFNPQFDQNNLDLYSGLITWGAYNKRRREIYTQFKTR